MRAIFLSCLFLATLFSGGCSTVAEIQTQADSSADFSHYRSFAFFQPLGTDKEGYASLLSLHLREAARRELEARGYRYEEKDPDLLVNFNAETREKTSTTSSPHLGYYSYWGHWHGVWTHYDMTTTRYEEAILRVDLIDARKKQTVWEGSAKGMLTQQARKYPGASAMQALADIFRHYPHRSGDRASGIK
jgi:hypothetical protein